MATAWQSCRWLLWLAWGWQRLWEEVRWSRGTKRRTVLSRRGMIRGKGEMVIFTVRPPSENATNRNISTRRRSERWLHLNRSYGCGVMRCRRSGTYLWIFSSSTGPWEENLKAYKEKYVFLLCRRITEKAFSFFSAAGWICCIVIVHCLVTFLPKKWTATMFCS